MSKLSKRTYSVPVFEILGNLTSRYRFYIKSDHETYRLFSFEMMSDGSVIFIHSASSGYKYLYGNLNISKRGTRVTKFKDANSIDVNPSDNVGKITFHTSGVVNTYHERFIRESLRTMDMTEPLATIIYRHVSFMNPERVRRKRGAVDILFEHDIAQDRYLQSRIFLSAEGHNNIKDYVQNGSFALASVEFCANTIEHSSHKIFLQILIEDGPKVGLGNKRNKKDLMLMTCLPEQLIPKNLRPT